MARQPGSSTDFANWRRLEEEEFGHCWSWKICAICEICGSLHPVSDQACIFHNEWPPSPPRFQPRPFRNLNTDSQLRIDHFRSEIGCSTGGVTVDYSDGRIADGTVFVVCSRAIAVSRQRPTLPSPSEIIMQLLSRLMQLLSVQTPRRRESRTRSYSGGNLELRALLCSCTGSHPVDVDALATPAAVQDNVALRIVNGTATSDYPSVGKVGDTGGYGCSGTLIAPQYVLTAAHCAEGFSDTGGRFFVGGQEYRTTKVYVHPNYNPNRLGQDGANDIAIFKLDRPVTNVTPTPINRTTPAVGNS